MKKEAKSRSINKNRFGKGELREIKVEILERIDLGNLKRMKKEVKSRRFKDRFGNANGWRKKLK